MKNMKNKSGEAMTLALVGLLVGAVMLYINTGNEAQALANSTGRTVDQWGVIKETQGKSAATVLIPAASGWWTGYTLEKVTGDGGNDSQDTTLEIRNNGAPVYVEITGNPTTTTETRTDTRTDNSVRE